MGRVARRSLALTICCLIALFPFACIPNHHSAPPSQSTPQIRVRLLAGEDRITLRATASPTAYTRSDPTGVRLNFPADSDVTISADPAGWRIGSSVLACAGGATELKLVPSGEATLAVNGRRYRGAFRILVRDGKLDVINDVDVENYLKSVVSRELLHDWNEETYKAQAIIARTYAIYQAKTAGAGRAWDVSDDTRSQVYGGIDDESSRSRDSVDETAGIVVAYGSPGNEKIFKTYFSACCGGISLSAADAFNDSYIVPLSDQDVHAMCAGSKWFNWGPVEIDKAELTRRLRMWGARRKRGEQNMAKLDKLEIQFVNRFNRPTRFLVTDVRGIRYSLMSEELRNAVNIDATKDTKLYSSFFKVINDPASDVIRFVEGHGMGHGVGMCQYCSEARAEGGMRHEDIVLSAYPRARLARAY